MKTYCEVLKLGIEKYKVDAFDGRILLSYILGINSSDIVLYNDRVVTDAQQQKFMTVLERRQRGEPVDLIMGTRGFYLGEFKVTSDVLSPRPDTECIVEGILRHAPKDAHILDLGTGSGCIIISLLMALKKSTGTGVDISDKALSVAKYNSAHNKVDSRSNFMQSNWFENVTGVYDVVVSNPPYIPSQDIMNLQDEVKKHDPMLALDGGSTGLEPYYKIAKNAKLYLKENGIVAVEFGINQARCVQDIFETHGFERIESLFDLGKIERGLMFKAVG